MRRRTLLLAALAVPAVIATAWIALLAAVVAEAHRDGAAQLAEPAAAIIVLGAAQYDGRPSPGLRARLDQGIALWRAGRAPRLIVTGGSRAGDRTTEAAVGRRYAMRHGVPDSVILLESEGRTTSESLRAASALLRELARQDSTQVEGGVPGGTPRAEGNGVRAERSDGADDARPYTAILVSDPLADPHEPHLRAPPGGVAVHAARVGEGAVRVLHGEVR
jgi:hypothetical protein